jgi:hypothetical protein
MTVGTPTKPAVVPAFPLKDVEAQLRSSLHDLVSSNAALHGTLLPSGAAAQAAYVTQIDSLDVVDVLCGIEPIVGFELKDSIVKAGGYPTINAAIDHVLPRIQSAWEKHGKKGAKK